MSSPLSETELLKMLALGKTEQAIKTLLSYLNQFVLSKHKQNFVRDEVNKLTLISGKLREITHEFTSGLINEGEAVIRKNAINHAFVEFINKLPDYIYTPEVVIEEIEKANVNLEKESQDGEFSYDLFLCFSSDDIEEAKKIYQELTSQNFRVFFSEESLKYEAGISFFEKIEKALLSSKHFLLLSTQNSVSSEWVKVEYETFFNECYIADPSKRKFFVFKGNDFNIDNTPHFLRRLQFVDDIESLVLTLDKQEKEVESPKTNSKPKIDPKQEEQKVEVFQKEPESKEIVSSPVKKQELKEPTIEAKKKQHSPSLTSKTIYLFALIGTFISVLLDFLFRFEAFSSNTGEFSTFSVLLHSFAYLTFSIGVINVGRTNVLIKIVSILYLICSIFFTIGSIYKTHYLTLLSLIYLSCLFSLYRIERVYKKIIRSLFFVALTYSVILSILRYLINYNFDEGSVEKAWQYINAHDYIGYLVIIEGILLMIYWFKKYKQSTTPLI
jgi:hypothetical protein